MAAPGPMTSATSTNPLESVSYEDLYRRWELGNWRAMEIDFSRDRAQWRELFSDLERRAARWNYALFFWGEDAVADNLSPYIDAAPREEQKYFLATQQVDEARHAVFFGRFMREVVGLGDSIGSSLEAIRPELTWGFKKVFERLDTMADELRRDRSKPKLAAAITLYHVVIEASLAQPGQHFIERYLHERDVLPAFREGMANVSQDEQRHIGFGVKLLADLSREDPDCRYAVAELLREVVPYTAGVLIPPDWDLRYIECFGSTLEEVGTEGTISLETKLRSAGLPVEELPGPPIMPMDLSPTERANYGNALVRAGILGDGTTVPARDADTMRLLFEAVRRGVDPDGGLPRTTIQWEFRDADPWFITVDNGSTSATQGRLESPDVTLRCRYEDWVDVVGNRKDPRRLLLLGRLRFKGSPAKLLRFGKIFPR